MKENNKFYVYVYLDPSEKGEYVFGDLRFEYMPFYIGKGSGDRFKHHLKSVCLKKNTHKNNKIKKILKEKKEPKIFFLHINLTEKEALLKEKEIIKKIGLQNLTNVTSGGIGTLNYKHSTETKEKIKNALKGKNKGRRLTESWKLKIKINNSKYWLGKKHSEKTIDKLRKLNLGKEYPNRRKTYKIINPNGEEVITSKLSEFCKKNNLQRTKIVSVANGHRNHHKNFKCIKLDN